MNVFALIVVALVVVIVIVVESPLGLGGLPFEQVALLLLFVKAFLRICDNSSISSRSVGISCLDDFTQALEDRSI